MLMDFIEGTNLKERLRGEALDMYIVAAFKKTLWCGYQLSSHVLKRKLNYYDALSFEEVKKCVDFLFDRWFSGPQRKLIEEAKKRELTKECFLKLRGSTQCFLWTEGELKRQELKELVKLLKELNLRDLFEFSTFEFSGTSAFIEGKKIYLDSFNTLRKVGKLGVPPFAVISEKKIPFEEVCDLFGVRSFLFFFLLFLRRCTCAKVHKKEKRKGKRVGKSLRAH